MPSEQQVTIQGFSGVVSSIDPSLIPQNAAQSLLNVRTERGDIRVRPGWRQLSGAFSGIQSNHGLDPVDGNNGSSLIEEYIAFIKSGGTLKPYSIHVTSGAKTEIQNDGSPLSLSEGEWASLSFDSYSYSFKRGSVAYRHEVGNNDDFALVDADRPAAPPAPSVFSNFTPPDVPSNGTVLDWTSGSPLTFSNQVVYGSGSTVSLNPSSSPIAAPITDTYGKVYSGDVTGSSPFTFEASVALPSSQDYSDQSYIEMPIVLYSELGTRSMSILNATIACTLVNSLGDDQALVETYSGWNNGKGLISAILKLSIPAGADPAVLADVVRIHFVVTYTTSATITGPNYIRSTLNLGPLTPVAEGAGDYTPKTPSGSEHRVRFGLVHYDSERDVESDPPTPTEWLKIDSPVNWFNDDDIYLGNVGLTLSGIAPSSLPGTHTRLYVQFESDMVWRLHTTTDDNPPSIEVDDTYAELIVLPIREALAPNPLGNVNCAATYNGWMVWGLPGGRSNLKHSKVGSPTSLARETANIADTSRGANFTMADNFADAPIWMGQAGRGFVILGSRGAYVQTGDSPTTCTPPARVRNAKGVYGFRAACRFGERTGNPVIAYITTSLDLYFLAASQVDPGGNYGYQLYEAGSAIRGEIVDFLGGGTPPSASKLCLIADEIADSLMICYEDKAIVFRRIGLVDGVRVFELDRFAQSSSQVWNYFTSHPYYGVRAIRSNGGFDELYRNSSSNFADIVGANRDNGLAVPEPFWRGRKNASPYIMQVTKIEAIRTDMTDTPTVKVKTERVERTVTFQSGFKFGRGLWADVRGHEYEVAIYPNETDEPFRYLILSVAVPNDRGYNK